MMLMTVRNPVCSVVILQDQKVVLLVSLASVHLNMHHMYIQVCTLHTAKISGQTAMYYLDNPLQSGTINV